MEIKEVLERLLVGFKLYCRAQPIITIGCNGATANILYGGHVHHVAVVELK